MSRAADAAGRHRAPRTFGVEEEFLLLHASDGTPADRAAEMVRSVPASEGEAEHEYFSSQLETSTPVCHEASEAEDALNAFREAAARAGGPDGPVLAGTGLPPVGGEEPGTVTPKDRYRAIAEEMRDAAAYQYVTGLHVHVAIPSRDAGAAALTRLGRWAPALLAMTANSPLWCGEPTGYASWRHVTALTWPLSGYPPAFADGAEYTRAVERLVASGVLLDPGLVTWLARLSQNYPTLELRIADAQLEAADSVAFAVLVRALVDRALSEAEAGEPQPDLTPGMVDGAIWVAARNGLESTLVDPLTAEPVPAGEMLDRMLRSVEPQLERNGDLDRVSAHIERLKREGSPARRQRERFEDAGIPGLLALYRGKPLEPASQRPPSAGSASAAGSAAA